MLWCDMMWWYYVMLVQHCSSMVRCGGGMFYMLICGVWWYDVLYVDMRCGFLCFNVICCSIAQCAVGVWSCFVYYRWRCELDVCARLWWYAVLCWCGSMHIFFAGLLWKGMFWCGAVWNTENVECDIGCCTVLTWFVAVNLCGDMVCCDAMVE